MFDSHAHIVTGDTTAFPAARPEDPRVAAMLKAPFPAEMLLAQMADCGVSRALVVQRGQVYGHDNSYVLAAARAHHGQLLAVCGVDATAPDSAGTMERLHAQGAAGFRLMARMGDPSMDWLAGHEEGFWATASTLGLPVCVHLFDWNRAAGLALLTRLLARHRIERVVIDHLTNGPIASTRDTGIDEALRTLAGHAGLALKFTAIPLNGLAQRHIDAGAVLDSYLDLMGEHRLIWGSDITQSAGTYPAMVASGRAAVSHLPGATQDRLLGSNTADIYDA
jgi:L-fuconolactonase